jgi:DNA-binding transcriptional LysR family regulator
MLHRGANRCILLLVHQQRRVAVLPQHRITYGISLQVGMTSKEPAPRNQAAPRENGWALDLEFRQLRAFVRLVDRGSMTAAARDLGVAQSTVSEVMAALERALGTRLVTRRRGVHGVALTPAGQALLPYARSVLASLEDAHVAVAAVDREVRGSVEVIANESVSTYLLPRALGELRKQWPNTRFAVTVGMCPSITGGVSTGRYDVGLMLQTKDCPPTHAPGEGTQHGTRGGLTLTEVPLVVFAAAGHPLISGATGARVQRDQLTPFTVFVSDARGHFFDMIRDFFRCDGVPGPRLEPTGSVEGVKQSVIADPLGLGVLPGYALEEEFRTGRARAVPLVPDLPPLRLEAMLYRGRSPKHPALMALLDTLRFTLARSPLAQSPELRMSRRGGRLSRR